jgi:hypothetical protein
VAPLSTTGARSQNFGSLWPVAQPRVVWATLVGYVVGYVVALVTLIQFHDGAFTAVACFVAGIGGASYFRKRALRSKVHVRVD